MDERIKQLRKSLGMSQETFAKEIGLTKNFISLVETGQRNLSTQSIKLICQLFNVDVEWLETGKGEMFIQKTESEKIAEFLADVLKAGEICVMPRPRTGTLQIGRASCRERV